MKTEQDRIRFTNELSSLEEARVVEATADRRTMVATVLLSSLIGLILIGFLLVNFFYFNEEWTEEKFSKSLNRELEEISPMVSLELEELGKNLAPVFAQESRKQFPEMAPLLAEKIGEELQKFTDEFQAEIISKLNRSGERLKTDMLQSVLQCYPDLVDEREQEKLIQQFRITTDEAMTAAIVNFQDRFSVDVADLRATVFNVPETDVPTMELQKRFIRLWLQLLDEEIMKL
jgi:hypothetical protein